MIDVKEEDDGTFTISWDENDPSESFLNSWTEEDFINAIMDHVQKTLDNIEEPNNYD